MIYAQLDERGVVIAVSQLAAAIDRPNMIELPSYDASLIGKRHEAGQFITIEQPVAELGDWVRFMKARGG